MSRGKRVGMAPAVCGAFGLLAGIASAQSLYLEPAPILARGGAADLAAPLNHVSMLVVVPPEPREIKKHDLVEILINEATSYKVEASLDLEKEYDLDAELAEFLSMQALWDGRLESGDSTPVAGVGVNADKDFSGEGERESRDNLTSRITAVVIDVKPNGNLVLEAKETIDRDGEIKSMVLSGVCRQEDVTESNTIQSTKLANLTIRLHHEGDVRKASKRGVIAEALDTIFAF